MCTPLNLKWWLLAEVVWLRLRERSVGEKCFPEFQPPFPSCSVRDYQRKSHDNLVSKSAICGRFMTLGKNYMLSNSVLSNYVCFPELHVLIWKIRFPKMWFTKSILKASALFASLNSPTFSSVRFQTFRWRVSQMTWQLKKNCYFGLGGWWRDTRTCAVTTSPPGGGMASSLMPSYTNTGETPLILSSWRPLSRM